jgi:hypothetical protein
MISQAIVFTGLSAVTKNLKVIGFSRWRQQIEIRACARMVTSGLLLVMVTTTSIDELRALFQDDAKDAH